MPRLLSILLFVSFAASAAEQADRKQCVDALKKFGGEKWCNSEERESCLKLHGAEWCDASAEGDLENKYVDRQLNDLYKKIMQKANERQQKAIRESQRLWLQYLTHECNARYEMVSTGDPVMRSNLWRGCQIEFRKLRVKEFEREYCSLLGGC